MKKRRKKGMSEPVRRADDAWLAEGGLDRPHTKIGVATARRLMPYHHDRVKELQAYIKSAPKNPPVSDYEAEHGRVQLPKRPKPERSKVRYREISGGAPGLGKRR